MEQRSEKGDALNVVPVKVGEEEMNARRATRRDVEARSANAGATVKKDYVTRAF